MPYLLITPPVNEPIDLATARMHLRADASAADDTLITAAISAARSFAENQTQRQFVTATWKLVLDAFPGPSIEGMPPGNSFSLPSFAILLNKSPVQSITSIRYLDMSGTWQTMLSTDYVADLSSEPCRITPVFGKIWQPTLPQIASVEVLFVAGYGAPILDGSNNITGWTGTAVPTGILNWMKLRIGSYYEYRQEQVVVPRGKIEALPFVDGLLDEFKVLLY